jgi:hypothetical protein
MLTESISPRGSEQVLLQVAAEIVASHRDHLRELRIEIVEGGLIIRGRAVSYYGKQIAFQEVTRRGGIAVVANEIEVQHPPDE